MQRRVTFWALIATVLVVGVLFFQIIQPFLAPLFFAAVLALLFAPIFRRTRELMGGRHRAAAGITVVVLLLCLLPVGIGIVVVAREAMSFGEQFSPEELTTHPQVMQAKELLQKSIPGMDVKRLEETLRSGLQTTATEVFKRTQSFLSNIVAFVVGLGVMGLALYYFLAEGPMLLKKTQRLLPLDDNEEEILFDEFARVCRGVVVGTLACAAAQSVLMGIGLWIAGVGGILLLSGLTLLFSMVPVVGAAGLWGPVSLWLLFQGEYGSGIFLAIYGAAVVSGSDNLIRAYVLNGTAGMHPLLALVSALGGLSLLGVWGMFVGPIVAALFYTLLKVLHDRLETQETIAGDDVAAPPPVDESGPTHSPSTKSNHPKQLLLPTNASTESNPVEAQRVADREVNLSTIGPPSTEPSRTESSGEDAY